MKVERQAGRLVATDGFTSGGSAAAAPRNSGTPLDRDRGREGGVLESHGTGREQEEQSEEDFFSSSSSSSSSSALSVPLQTDGKTRREVVQLRGATVL